LRLDRQAVRNALDAALAAEIAREKAALLQAMAAAPKRRRWRRRLTSPGCRRRRWRAPSASSPNSRAPTSWTAWRWQPTS
ncbi:MAG TPA: hypothetical protein VKA16_07955, partial [Burkholderiales bacterium]|nr:hypothetical protein [Burkholderiales bacterium]